MDKRRSFYRGPSEAKRMDKRMSLCGSSEVLHRSASRQSLGMSTRMKKVAPPPPPVPLVGKSPPLPNGNLSLRRASSAPPPLATTPGEDCAIDELLEGRMELEVILPDCKIVKMTVDRRTPMMDLLVQIATSNKISPSGHVIKVISREERSIHYKPNTPIGSLDANTVYIVPKSTLEATVKRMPKLANQPFEQTFRLQVNLPLNQRMVLRVSPRITLAELKHQICTEKELEHASHHLVHPAQPDTVLDLNATLEVYGCAEISLMSNSGLRDSIRNTSTNLFPYPKEEEKKKKGILRLFSRKKKEFTIETPVGSNGLTSSQSEHSTLNRNNYQPKQSIKRKPAPAPPPVRNSSPPLITQSSNSINSRPESEISVKTADEIESSVSHSRHSSDSSGYHEPSVFSDCSENKSPEASIVHGDTVSDANQQNSPTHKDYVDNDTLLKRSSMTAKDTNLKTVPSGSNVSIISASRKRKAPQPPISTLPAIESPSSPEAPPIDSIGSQPSNGVSVENASCSTEDHGPADVKSEGTSVQQESEALQYLEDVLQQESENCVKNFSTQTMMDDSDTDSQRDETEVISVCQAEIHANDQDSSDSIVEPQTIVIPEPAQLRSSFASQSAPNPQPDGCEVVDTSADDSGISQSLNSDAESSVPSLNSDLKTLSDSGCHEEIYCNVTDSLDAKSVPSSDEFPAQDVINIEEDNAFKNSEIEEKTFEDENSPGTVTATSDDSTNSEGNNATERTVLVSDDQLSTCDEKISPTEITAIEQNLISDLEKSKESNCDNVCSDKNSVISSLSTDSAQGSVSNTPPIPRKLLDNFALGCYKKEQDVDIYGVPSAEQKESMDKPQSSVSSSNKEIVKPMRKSKIQPDVKIVSFKDRNQTKNSLEDEVLENGTGNVQEKCSQLSNMSTLPLTGRSSSLYNLMPQQKLQVSTIQTESLPEMADESLKRTLSDQNIAKELEPLELKATFIQEQKRLQEEYLRLQEKFFSWQKQLLSNQNLLHSENIVPQMPFPTFESIASIETITQKTTSENLENQKPEESANYNELKTRSLPRPKTKSLSLRESSQPKDSLQSPIKTAIVEIDIESQEPVKRPNSLSGCSVDTQATVNQDDKVIQVPSPQDKVTSSTQAPSPENVLCKETSAQTSDNVQVSSPEVSSISDSTPSPDNENSKSQTLPRPKSKPISALNQPSRTMTLNRNSRPKSQAVSVTIGSWQQRQASIADIEPSNIASSRSKFMSLESIPPTSKTTPPAIAIEKRKLPPVPNEVDSSENTLHKNIVKPLEPKIEIVTVPKAVPTSYKSKPTVQKETIDNSSTLVKSTTDSKQVKTVPKQVEKVPQKQKIEIKLASRDPTATFKQAKPFVKLSSMKDEPHQPSIIGLKKWPLSNINESTGFGDGKQSILDDLKASSRKPGGFVQEKIRRAEVDLRKPKSTKSDQPAPNTQLKSSKTDPLTIPKSKDTSGDTSKLHISKININNFNTVPDSNQTAVKEIIATSRVVNNAHRSNTIPKSQSLNSELLSVFAKKTIKDSSDKQDTKLNGTNTVTVNGGIQSSTPPPPPPPPEPVPQATSSRMPIIPPAEQIPVSSQLLMAGSSKTLPPSTKHSKKSPSKHKRSADPREELMLEIRGFGGKQALRTLYEKSCLTFRKKSPKKKTKEDPSSSSHQQ